MKIHTITFSFILSLVLLLSAGQLANAQWVPGTSTTENNVGIGTLSPLYLLHIDQNVYNANTVFIRNGSAKVWMARQGKWAGHFQSGSSNVYLAYKNGNGIHINTNATTSSDSNYGLFIKSGMDDFILRTSNDGKVVLGAPTSDAPDLQTVGDLLPYRLFVNGGALFKEVKVDTDWADYVFEDQYQLTPLAEVEQFIEENGHLHNTPSAEALEQSGGIELGAITVNQQEKIEELFLHLIELDKAVKTLQAENANLKAAQK